MSATSIPVYRFIVKTAQTWSVWSVLNRLRRELLSDVSKTSKKAEQPEAKFWPKFSAGTWCLIPVNSVLNGPLISGSVIDI